jgi:hypothetical protein
MSVIRIFGNDSPSSGAFNDEELLLYEHAVSDNGHCSAGAREFGYGGEQVGEEYQRSFMANRVGKVSSKNKTVSLTVFRQ